MTKWRWQSVKQVGVRPSLRSGMSVAVAPNARVFLFGGVQDVKDEDEDIEGTFFNELYSLHVENERATWKLGNNHAESALEEVGLRRIFFITVWTR